MDLGNFLQAALAPQPLGRQPWMPQGGNIPAQPPQFPQQQNFQDLPQGVVAPQQGNTDDFLQQLFNQQNGGQGPVNVLQQAGIDPTMPQPAPVSQQPQPAQQAPRARRSLLDTIGGIADVLAKVGGADPLYQPTLDARQQFNQNAATTGLQQDVLRAQGTKLGDEHQATLRDSAASTLAGIAGQPNAGALWRQYAPAELPVAVREAVAQQLDQNPESAPAIAKIFGYEPKAQGTPSDTIQRYNLAMQIGRPDLAEQILKSSADGVKYQDFGGYLQPVNAATGAPAGPPIPKTETPDNAADRAARAEAQRLALEEKRQHDQEMLEAKLGAPVEKIRATFPKVTASYNAAVREINSQIADVDRLITHKGLEGITGAIQGRIGFSLRDDVNAAQALLDKIKARGTLRSLQDLRNNSPTGGALGNISNQDTSLLGNSFGALNQAQGDEDFKAALNQYVSDLRFSKQNITESYIETRDLIKQAPARGRTITPVTPRGNRSGKTPATGWSIVGVR